MKETLVAGISAHHQFHVTDALTVPRLAIGNALFSDIPDVLATAMMVAMMEGTATKALTNHLDLGEGSVGLLVNVTHIAATLPGQTVTVTAEVTAVEGRKVTFKVAAHDGIDKIGEGIHQRVIVPWRRFETALAAKAAKVESQRPDIGTEQS